MTYPLAKFHTFSYSYLSLINIKHDSKQIIYYAWTGPGPAQAKPRGRLGLQIWWTFQFFSVVTLILIYSLLLPTSRPLISALLYNNVNIAILLRIMTLTATHNTVSRNFVLLTTTKFWDRYSVSNWGGSWICCLLGRHLGLLRPWA
jgi:hypothetical protein